MEQVNGQINTIHDDSIELTEFVEHFSPFNLDELESNVCKIADQYDGIDDSRLDDKRRQASQDTPALTKVISNQIQVTIANAGQHRLIPSFNQILPETPAQAGHRFTALCGG